MNRREALRGAEIQTFDLLDQILTSEQWAGLLEAPLRHAAAMGNRGLAQKLVGAGAETRDALHAAARGGHAGVVNDLLENGASVAAKSGNGYTPLHVASQAGKTEMVQVLLLKGADKDALDSDECTPLFVAVEYGHMTAALALLAAGADVSLRYGVSNITILHLAAESDHVDIMRAAIDRGAEVDAVDTNKLTALHYALLHNTSGAIDVLVDAEANIEARDDEGDTPLHHAAWDRSVNAVLALLKHGAHVNARSDSLDTPLHWTSTRVGKQRAAEVVDLLLRSGADETILNDYGKTAADMMGRWVEEEDQVVQDVDCVHQLLANAPADRAWRRRGYLVLCRAHPDRVQQTQDITSANAGAVRRTRSTAELGRTETGSCNGTAGGRIVDEQIEGWALAAARVLELQEGGIFRTIVRYL